MSMGLARRLALVIVSSVVALVVAPFASASQPAPSPKVPCAPMVALVFKDDDGSFLAPVGEEDLLPARLVTQSRGFCANSQATGFDSGTASTFDGSSATTGFPTFHGSAPSDNEHRSSRAVYRQQISRALTYDPSPSSTTVSQFVATETGVEAGAGGKGAPKPSPDFETPTNAPQDPPNQLKPGHNVRVMGPTEQYPDGYWVETNAAGQPIDPSTGKPPSNVTRAGSRARTHVPLPPK